MSGQAADAALWTVPARRLKRPLPATGSVQARLIILATSAILPMLLLFTAVAYHDYRAERVRAGERELNVVRSMAATVERELRIATASLQALALSPRLQEDDLPGFHQLATRFIDTAPPGSALLLYDVEGRTLLDTQDEQSSAPVRHDAGLNTAPGKTMFQTGQPMVSNLFPRMPGGSLIVTADVPVLRDGRVAYGLSLVLPAGRFAGIIAEQRLPPGTMVTVLDHNGISVARLPDPGHYVGRAASPTLLRAVGAHEEGVVNSVSLEGVPLLTAYSHAKPSGWCVAMGVPDAVLRTPLMASLRLALGLGLVGSMASATVAAVVGRRILRPIRALARMAADPARSMPCSLGLSELDAVGAALRHSLRERQAAMTALQALNEDLEARIRQETARRVEVQAQLAQSQRMEALGQLAGGIAHDFNNVLQAVTGGLSLIQHRASDEASVHRLAALAAGAAARGSAITGRLLTFARRGELAAMPVAPAALLQGLNEMLAHTLGSLVAVHVLVPDATPNLCADKAQLETVLINLAINARDAMPSGGTLTLSAEAASNPWPTRLPAGAYIRLCLTDDGVGMSPEVLSRASEPFFTTKEPGQGTGLGLAMARGFAEQSGGAFTIASRPGQGTTVSLWFPQARAPVPAEPGAGAAAAWGDETPMQVLMVDDDDMVREVLAGEMESRGFLVTTAADGAAALALLDAGQPADLLITDYAMAGMNGLVLIGAARRSRPNLPALLLTGYAEPDGDAALAAAQDRQTVLLHKPIAGGELAAHAAGLRRRH